MTSGRGSARVYPWVALLVAFAAWSCGGASFPSGQPGQVAQERHGGWLEVESPHYLMHTDLPEHAAREMARSLEDARSALLASAWAGGKGPQGRTRIVVFAKPADFQRYTGAAGNVAGIAMTRPGFERWIAFSPGRDNGIPRIAKHELVHDLSQWFLPLQPPWLAEGLAGYLEGFRFDPEHENVVAGELSEEFIDWLKQTKTLTSSTRLFDATALHSSDPREGYSFYAGAWFLVHYLLNQRGEAFGQFQRSMMRLVPWRKAWEEAFPELSPAALDEDMIKYAKEGQFTLVVEPFEPLAFEPVLRPLTPAQAEGVRALLGGISGLDVGAEIDAALTRDPNELSALVARFHFGATHDESVREDIARRASAAHPESGEAWLLRARVAREVEEQRQALDRAFALAPHHPGVLWLLANDALGRGQPKRALELVRLAERRSGLAASMLAVHVGALIGMQRCQDAERLVESSASLLPQSCQMPHPTLRQTVSCAESLRAAYDAAAPSCNAVPQAANAPPVRAHR